jgi:hypothetical protein
MYTVYYDEKANNSDGTCPYVKIHKGDKNGTGGCGHIKKDDCAVKEHTGERESFNTLIGALRFVVMTLKLACH